MLTKEIIKNCHLYPSAAHCLIGPNDKGFSSVNLAAFDYCIDVFDCGFFHCDFHALPLFNPAILPG
jgi:hypothetical protein